MVRVLGALGAWCNYEALEPLLPKLGLRDTVWGVEKEPKLPAPADQHHRHHHCLDVSVEKRVSSNRPEGSMPELCQSIFLLSLERGVPKSGVIVLVWGFRSSTRVDAFRNISERFLQQKGGARSKNILVV